MGMAIGSQGKKGRSVPEMNVTPLVDVVLVLLIIFMVITPMLAKQFWLGLPSKPKEDEPVELAQPSETKAPIVVTVTERGEIRINKDVISEAEFPTKLTRVLAARGDRTVFFDAHDRAPFAKAAHALDLARSAGASSIVVATESITKD